MAKDTKIEAVQTCIARVPLDVETSFATRKVKARDYCLVRIRTADGAEGIGFCYAGSSGGSVVAAAIRDLLVPVLLGQDPHRVEGLWQEMYQEALLHGRTGSVMRALSALDIALWDRNARSCALPLWRLLGSMTCESVPAYASGGYYLSGKTAKALAQEMIGYVESGFNAVKMKVGLLDPAAEEERISAVRDAVGPDVLLMLDANNAWRDLPTALRYMDRYEPYDPYWIEEPFSPDDIENHARLAAATKVTVATGEIEAGRWRFKELLDKEAAGILQSDAAVCGGISEWRRIAATAASYEVTVSPHWFHDLHVHLVASTPNARFVEFFPDDQVLNFRRLIDRQLTVRTGRLLLPEEPGLGFNFDEEAVARYAQGGWQEVR
ncbi:MAG TPA: mandelate racemase/muconate lactonizing enzyme family protein [Hyphomicrobiales bacterium]|nr:mandelate racemase/muconate lactonizing enzyme family protein [Hyphomicrobiales bacterium]